MAVSVTHTIFEFFSSSCGEGIYHDFAAISFAGLPALDFRTRYFSKAWYVLKGEELAIPIEMDPWGTLKKMVGQKLKLSQDNIVVYRKGEKDDISGCFFFLFNNNMCIIF